ncbi:MAG: hypothetical protein OXK78_09110 [Caldilineaceae bacterium]|nr:hypothetical protein [Caldilineaceae bacterium]
MIDAYRYRKYAEELIAEAETAYEEARANLGCAHRSCGERLHALGCLRVALWRSQIDRFISLYSKIHQVESQGDVDEVDNVAPPDLSPFVLKELKRISSSVNSALSPNSLGVAAGATSAAASYGVGVLATGSSAISTASNAATLSWLGGGTVAAGGVMLCGIFLGPAILVSGLARFSREKENLAKVEIFCAQIEEDISKMEAVMSILHSIGEIGLQYNKLIEELSERTKIFLDELEALITHKAAQYSVLTRLLATLLGNRYPVVKYSELTEEEKRIVYVATQFATALASTLSAPILAKDVTDDGMALDGNWRKPLEQGRRLLRMKE